MAPGAIEIIRSRSNFTIKRVARYLRGDARNERWVLVEGRKNVLDLLGRGLRPEVLVATPRAAVELSHAEGLRVVSDDVYSSLTQVKTPEGVFGLFEAPAVALSELAGASGPLIYLHGVQDPGNAGAVVRTAAALDACGIVFGPGCASPWSPKVSRGSAGTLLYTRFALATDTVAALSELRTTRPVIAAVPRGGADPGSSTIPPDPVIVLGSEGRGLPAEVEALATHRVTIPVRVESLNVAVAAGILLYALLERRA